MAQVNSRTNRAGNTQARRWTLTITATVLMTITCCVLRSAPLNFCCSYYTDCVRPVKPGNAYIIHNSHSTDSSTQNDTQFTQRNARHNEL